MTGRQFLERLFSYSGDDLLEYAGVKSGVGADSTMFGLPGTMMIWRNGEEYE